MINPLDVVVITNDKLEADGLPINTRVIVAGLKALPLTEDDPYTQRIKLFVQKINETEDGVEGPIFMIDPASVKETGIVAVDNDATIDR